MIEREYYWVDTEKALQLPKRIGLDGLGLLTQLCGHFYCGAPIADDPAAVAAVVNCSTGEWLELRQRLLDAGEIAITDGLIVPTGHWHKPVEDS